MEKDIVKKAVLFYGPPGSGKGTQAQFLVDRLGFTHFDTGKFIEAMVHDESLANDPIVKKERKLFFSGKLNTPKWVLEMVKTKIGELKDVSDGLVFSGSPRTEYEAFSTKKEKGVLEELISIYGKDNIVAFHIEIPVTESVKRNSLRGREGLDDPKIIRVRCKEYKERTTPIIKGIKQMGIRMYKIDGIGTPKKISASVFSAWKEYLKSLKPVKAKKVVAAPAKKKK